MLTRAARPDAAPASEARVCRAEQIEQRCAHGPANWWIPNRACAEATLRAAGFEIVDHPDASAYICRHIPRDLRPPLFDEEGPWSKR